MRNYGIYGIILLLILITVIGCSSPAAPSTPIPETPSTASSSPSSNQSTAPSASVSNQAGEEVNRIDFVYFHPQRRCALCLNIETLTKAFLEKNYKGQLSNGTITFTSYELDDKNNAAVVKKYGAISSQLFINVIVNGEENIEHIDQIWLPQVYNDATAFEDYLNGIVTNSLEAIS